MLFSCRIRDRVRFSVWLVSCYAHVMRTANRRHIVNKLLLSGFVARISTVCSGLSLSYVCGSISTFVGGRLPFLAEGFERLRFDCGQYTVPLRFSRYICILSSVLNNLATLKIDD